MLARQFACLASEEVLETGTAILVDFLEAFGPLVVEVGGVSRCMGIPSLGGSRGPWARAGDEWHGFLVRGHLGQSVRRFRGHEGGVALGMRFAEVGVVPADGGRHDPHEVLVIRGLLEPPGREVGADRLHGRGERRCARIVSSRTHSVVAVGVVRVVV